MQFEFCTRRASNANLARIGVGSIHVMGLEFPVQVQRGGLLVAARPVKSPDAGINIHRRAADEGDERLAAAYCEIDCEG